MKYSLQVVYLIALSAVVLFGYRSSQNNLDQVGVALNSHVGEYSNESTESFVINKPKVIYYSAAKERITRFDEMIKQRTDVREALANGEEVSYFYNFVELDNDSDNEIMFALSVGSKKKLLIYSDNLAQKLGEFPILNGAMVENSSQALMKRILIYDKMGQYRVLKFNGYVYEPLSESEKNVMNFHEINAVAYFTNLDSSGALTIK